MNRFEANSFPLSPGLRLLEASAGTGKTFALAHLVLRLVAEQGWPLRQLLVVTYTEAAAAELADRIGRRLQQALTCLETPGLAAPDPVLQQWLASCLGSNAQADGAAPAEGQPTAPIDALRGQLLLALEELDSADITTIHGFCRRSLQRQALEAGRPPELRLEEQGETVLAEVVHDYWQQQLLPLPLHLLAGLQAAQLSPQLLEQLLAQLDGDPALELDPLPAELAAAASLPERLPQLWQGRWQQFREQWQARGGDLQNDLLAEAAAWRAAGLQDSGDYKPSFRTNRAAELDRWLSLQPEEGDYEAVRLQKWLRGYFHPGEISRVARRAEGEQRPLRLPQEPLLAAIANLVEGPAELVLLHACHWGRAELARRRQRRGVTSFSQLLQDLDPGADEQQPSPLLEAVAQRYRAVLVDEFQDTDPIQWRILRRAFGTGQHPLVVVGDPKQAIYRFRGGDLDTYLAARDQAIARYDLVENRRSSAALIEGLNRLMAPGLRRSGLDVPPVQARARRSGPQGPPIELLWLAPAGAASGSPAAASRSELEACLPAWIAAALEQLLQAGHTLVSEGQARRLGPEDCCLLVNSHHQAEQLRQALEQRRIATRLVSKADVFASAAATALQRFLDALADPADANRLRLLAASPLLGWSAADLAASASGRWRELAGQLDGLARQLPRRGLLGVLADLLGAPSLARLALGGRQLADLQQAAELVQERIHADQLGVAAAAAWLRRLRLAEDREVPQEHQAHSDRVDGAVAVVTIHRSKGLEYPVVICPYLWQSAGGGQRGPARIGRRWQPPGASAPHLDLHLHPHWGPGHAAARQHRLAEERERERLAYVAVTRACQLLLLAWGPAKGQQANPLFGWLFPSEPLPDLDEDWVSTTPAASWRQRLEEQIEARQLPIRLLDPIAPSPVGAPQHNQEPRPLATGPVPERSLAGRWGRSSYTSWTQASHGQLAPEAVEAGRDTADTADLELGPGSEAGVSTTGVSTAGASTTGASASVGPQAPAWPEQGPLAPFPRGAAAGDCLHRMLERLELSSGFAGDGARAVVARELRRAGLQDQPLEPLLAGLEQMRTTPFGGPLAGLRVADLAPERRLHELNFDLSLGSVRASDLAAPFQAHPGGLFGADYGRRLAQLPIDSCGFLTGSIDLVFCVQSEAAAEAAGEGDGEREGEGRWWVADWKSNWLGQRDSQGNAVACGPLHYGQAAMAALMAASHYPLQAHLYLVALHRYLGWRLPHYDPARHLGGYAYVFLRGTPGASAQAVLPGAVPGMVVEQPPLARLLALDAALGGRGPA